jgi:hypothetical protein
MSNNVFYFLHESENIPIKRKYIYKISNIDSFIQNELINVQKLQNVFNYKSRFYICEKNDPLKIAKYQGEMHHLNSVSEDKTILFKFEEIELIYFKNYLKALSCSKKYIFTIISFYKYLLETLQILIDNNIVHNNIGFENIVINNKHRIPLLKSLTFSIDLLNPNLDSYLRQIFITYDPTFYQWPLEFHILSYLYTNKLESLSKTNIEFIISDVLKHHDLLHTFGESVVSTFHEEALNYFSIYINQSYEYIVADILKYSRTWDNYALSLIFLRILIYIYRTCNKQNKFIILFMKLLVSCISLNPQKRLSINETTNKFNSLLDSLLPTDYIEIINNLILL